MPSAQLIGEPRMKISVSLCLGYRRSNSDADAAEDSWEARPCPTAGCEMCTDSRSLQRPHGLPHFSSIWVDWCSTIVARLPDSGGHVPRPHRLGNSQFLADHTVHLHRRCVLGLVPRRRARHRRGLGVASKAHGLARHGALVGSSGQLSVPPTLSGSPA
jgi:hypothetical protein